MVDTVGSLGVIAFFAVYFGMSQQFRKVWQSQARPTVPKAIFAISFATYICWALWAFSLTPTDSYRIIAMMPGMIIVPVIWLQFSVARPEMTQIRSALWFGAVAVTIVLSIGIGATAWVKSHSPLFATMGLSCSVAYAGYALPWQIRELRKHGTDGSSLAFQLVILGTYIIWGIYAALIKDWILFWLQCLGTVLQSYVCWLHREE